MPTKTTNKTTATKKKVATVETPIVENDEVVVDTTVEVEATEEPIATIVVEEKVPEVEDVVEEVKVEVEEAVKVAEPVAVKLEGLYIMVDRAAEVAVQTRLARVKCEVKEGKYVGPFKTRKDLDAYRKVLAAVGIKTSIVEM